MTPAERAKEVWKGLSYDDLGRTEPNEFQEAMTAAIEVAVLEEREACAKVAAEIEDSMAEAIAERIRARSSAAGPRTSP